MDIDHDVPTVLATLRMEADPELFVSTFQTKINQLSLVTFGLAAAFQSADSNDALSFLSNLSDKVDSPETWDAHVYAQIEIARIKLHLKDIDGAKSLLDTASKTLDRFDSLDPLINASYYGVWSEYYKSKADFTAYYRTALLFLACVNLDEFSDVQKQQRAYDLSIAALLGDKIYNFGELLLHPILESLKNSEYQWLVDLLFALNEGNITAFEKLLESVNKQPILQNSLPFLRQKICLTALIEAVFKRPTSNRTLSFDTIAKETHLIADDVEHLVMKALSLDLLKGHIDEVSETVAITWLQPRVLNKANIESMRQRLVAWNNDVSGLSTWMESEGKDVWTTI
ncbi:hypothetical protein DV451_003767 [Geotrichum candidum]|uniref:PCI domain-containing protein n=1 Tax=Geotrichum candidum TaxID=1173061 RepID=A0A9P5G368_GEOCN|nr:hypothetical protein DV451_003767 [Geotrichum candidum]KAI9209975.1 hypothetical protein DS838_005144 [Geotrichum bryndzae]KAF5105542.1 hypothetical protein DV453_004749 [Geotrichum candidum]KAF5106954.1 hypothetical protein DV452_005015 [Geotrichum candidum]KAF5113267.1 hypothetical protein DV454_003690 [Geotrichum candidum]